MVGRVPAVGIGHAGEREAVVDRTLAVAHHAVELAHLVGVVPRAVIARGLAGIEQRAVGERHRAHAEEAPVAEAAERELGDLLGQAVEEVHVHRADRGEIALVGEIGPLADVDRADQLGDQEVEIGIALAVAVRAHVDGHVVDGDREIGAVVEIVAAQEILVGFALA